MLIRSITKHVKDQNWFAVLIDFAIVVFGVFIGIQVANWNEARVTEREAVMARSSLISDLRNDRDVYAVRRKFYTEVMDAALRVEGILASDLPPSSDGQWQFIYDASNAGGMWPFKPSGQVYNQLLNSGKLNLISTVSVQRQMRDYYQDAALEAGVTFKFDSDYRYNSRGLVDAKLEIYNQNDCENSIGADPSEIISDDQAYFPHCATPSFPQNIAETAIRLHTAENLLRDIRLQISQLGSLLAFIAYLDGEAEILISELEKP